MLARLSATDRFALAQGFRDFSPTLMAILSWGLVTGIAMSKSVLTTGQALGMSILVYAGLSQLAVLPLFAAKLPVWTILLTAAMVNMRFVIFSAGLAPHFSYLPLWRRLAIGYFNGDVIYLLFQKQGFVAATCPARRRTSGGWRSRAGSRGRLRRSSASRSRARFPTVGGSRSPARSR